MKVSSNGSLVVMVVPASGEMRLLVWSGTTRESGPVFGIDGSLLGFARGGQFLTAAACRSVADQLIRSGSVKRATLGVRISAVPREDPIRRSSPNLADRPAMRVEEVVPDSAAARAGLRKDDLILSVAGQSVGDVASFAAAIANCAGPTDLQVFRDGQVVTVPVNLEPK